MAVAILIGGVVVAFFILRGGGGSQPPILPSASVTPTNSNVRPGFVPTTVTPSTGPAVETRKGRGHF